MRRGPGAGRRARLPHPGQVEVRAATRPWQAYRWMRPRTKGSSRPNCSACVSVSGNSSVAAQLSVDSAIVGRLAGAFCGYWCRLVVGGSRVASSPSSAARVAVGGDLDPLLAGRWSLDPGLGQGGPEPILHEAPLVRLRGPDLEDDPAAVFGAAGVSEQSWRPVSRAALH